MVVASLLLIVCAVVLLAVGLGGGSNAFLAGSILASLLAAIALILAGRRSADRLSDVADRSVEAERARAASDRPDRVSVVDLLEADTERVNVPAARRRSERLRRVTVGAGAGSDADADTNGDPDDGADAGGRGGTGSTAERSVIPAQQTVAGRGSSTDDEPAVPEDEPEPAGASTVTDERDPAEGPAEVDGWDRAEGPAEVDGWDRAEWSAEVDGWDRAEGSAEVDGWDRAEGSADVDGWDRAEGSADVDEPDPADEPPAQASSPADAASIATMAAPVYVIDGRPRYHLRSCAHLLGRQSEALPVYEAVELEFTPCGLCEPDTRILAEARR